VCACAQVCVLKKNFPQGISTVSGSLAQRPLAVAMPACAEAVPQVWVQRRGPFTQCMQHMGDCACGALFVLMLVPAPTCRMLRPQIFCTAIVMQLCRDLGLDSPDQLVSAMEHGRYQGIPVSGRERHCHAALPELHAHAARPPPGHPVRGPEPHGHAAQPLPGYPCEWA